MPAGASPGERRGGRAAGTPNKATEERTEIFRRVMAVAFGEFSQEFIDSLSPAQAMRVAMRIAFRNKLVPEGLQLAKDAAPYFDRKLAPMEAQQSDEDKTVTIKGGLPDD